MDRRKKTARGCKPNRNHPSPRSEYSKNRKEPNFDVTVQQPEIHVGNDTKDSGAELRTTCEVRNDRCDSCSSTGTAERSNSVKTGKLTDICFVSLGKQDVTKREEKGTSGNLHSVDPCEEGDCGELDDVSIVKLDVKIDVESGITKLEVNNSLSSVEKSTVDHHYDGVEFGRLDRNGDDYCTNLEAFKICEGERFNVLEKAAAENLHESCDQASTLDVRQVCGGRNEDKFFGFYKSDIASENNGASNGDKFSADEKNAQMNRQECHTDKCIDDAIFGEEVARTKPIVAHTSESENYTVEMVFDENNEYSPKKLVGEHRDGKYLNEVETQKMTNSRPAMSTGRLDNSNVILHSTAEEDFVQKINLDKNMSLVLAQEIILQYEKSTTPKQENNLEFGSRPVRGKLDFDGDASKPFQMPEETKGSIQPTECLGNIRGLSDASVELQNTIATEQEQGNLINGCVEAHVQQLQEEGMRIQPELRGRSTTDMYCDYAIQNRVQQRYRTATLQQLIMSMKLREREQADRVQEVEKRLDEVLTLLKQEKENTEGMRKQLVETQTKLKEIECITKVVNVMTQDGAFVSVGMQDKSHEDFGTPVIYLDGKEHEKNDGSVWGAQKATYMDETSLRKHWEDLAYLNVVNVRMGTFMGF